MIVLNRNCSRYLSFMKKTTIVLRKSPYEFKGFLTSGKLRKNLHSKSIESIPEKITSINNEFKEVRIPVPWGHIAGKWFGSQSVNPTVAIHGRQDNAGSFDTLAPLLMPNTSILAIDLPGHGLSSNLPGGVYYHSIDIVLLLRMIMKAYNWDKISIMGHSLGSIIGFIFAGLFPDKVELLIGFDLLNPLCWPPKTKFDLMAKHIEQFLIDDGRIQNQQIEPPSFTYDELTEKLYQGSMKSINRNNCPYILNRNIKESTSRPNHYFFSRDLRIKWSNENEIRFPVEYNIELANRLKAPFLLIKTPTFHFEEKESFNKVLGILEKKQNFEFYTVNGTHHVHLNSAKEVSKLVNPFIYKYKNLK